MKLFNFRNTIVFVCVLNFSGLVLALEPASEPDIRFRSILYFYPEVKAPADGVVAAFFDRFEIVGELPAASTKPVVTYRLIEDLQDTYPVPDLDYLAYFGRGLDREQAVRIQNARVGLVVDIAYPMPMSVDGMKAANLTLLEIAEATGGVIWDSETRELFTPDSWQANRVAPWDGDLPILEKHTVIHAYQHAGGVRAISLGMAKFGLPDIVVNDFSWSLNRSMGNLINLVAQSFLEGQFPQEDGTLGISINELADTRYKQELVASLGINAQRDVVIQTGKGVREEGDPYNYIVELLFHDQEGRHSSEIQTNLLSSLFGWEDQVAYVQHNAMITAASESARQKLDGLKADFNAGLAPGEFILLKAPFDIPEGGAEWMWVEVLSWDDDAISGLLKNEPVNIPDLKGGSEVTVMQQDIFDFIRHYADGTSEGNETGELILKYQN
ncbi:DUF2314 domain-containing protein [Halopseudomonas salina]|uniref:DUF2314 domain-containing protein n=1 Tax=Halopseudomonas salina TaxID=1323744 RepID=A0ABQ1NT35_9GAMM|nr:DUF2314 domain-containing protein [Halopseudomonas salina]GGC84295.1 hypothetical protein GCM10007418_00160 [Halopseudomonas salina]